MKYLNGIDYLEVKDKRYNIRPNENIVLPEQKPPKSLGTQNEVQNETKKKKNQKVIENEYNELEVKRYPKKKPNF